ncbi:MULTISPECIES: SixA phosphatase family protein [Kordiimonas]|jgi:phosphohistidine phosphatase|uniref:Phosphohistidine phosphatase n=1 Tax=Kordiimonas lacus TaxID=637679 RepID=A0A1G6T2N8_9PROT|nr:MULTISPECIES: histidine phosphatase family protein [Kordiimonas]SDD23233.1 phosphohistidine phosphatase [Kordiimonas lacus]
MAKLFLLRHAKSDWGMGLPDHDRPLNARGQAAAAQMGQWLAKDDTCPKLVICSTAQRTRETLAILTEAGGLSFDVLYEPALYGAGTETIRQIIVTDAGQYESVLLIGHNPGFHDMAFRSAKGGDSELIRRLGAKYPTCTLSILEFDAPCLEQADLESGRLLNFVRPKDLT